ncbi:hypothetical protein FSB78_14295 [Sphingomonas ginsenosidivorax]|uniref:Methylamine utilization protein MauE n=1 Tax=Sphingomonas ginsenosidivorax TaxID=862135 RepID=A0A5C6UHX5_9SPHN|nr:MauE/DoxX family redox-associated membrane protein [Sphingomonas ginsenosidivorax]TXC71994.1 hypothetical protein FSB78_14295 [Sphingomonas ginsenosidivorax]
MWWLAVGLKVLIGMIFLSAGVSKAMRRSSLERMVRHHGIHNPLLVRLVSNGLLTAEITIGGILLIAWSRLGIRIGSAGAIALLLIFAALSLRLALLKRPFRCQCSPLLAGHTSGPAVALRNLGLAALTGMLFFLHLDESGIATWTIT